MTDYHMQALDPTDLPLMRALLRMFGGVFDDLSTDTGNTPDGNYLANLLAADHFVVLVALYEGEVIGGLAAYELKKFEQARSEL